MFLCVRARARVCVCVCVYVCVCVLPAKLWDCVNVYLLQLPVVDAPTKNTASLSTTLTGTR